jgi:rRNA maturation endonuclease Nob1
MIAGDHLLGIRSFATATNVGCVRLVHAVPLADVCPRCGAAAVVARTAELERLRGQERRAEPSREIEWKTCASCGYRVVKRFAIDRRG